MSRSDESVIWVADGVALLDEVWPGWEREIDLNRLDVSDADLCILGQLYGSFTAGLEVLETKAADCIGNFSMPSARFGFNAWSDELPEYDRLTDVWHAVITHRRGSALPVQ